MPVTVLNIETANTGGGANAIIAENNEAGSRFYLFHLYGDTLAIWDINSTTDLSIVMEFDMTSFPTPQPNPQICNTFLVNNNSKPTIINYNEGGASYAMPYIIATDMAGQITGMTQDTANGILLGTGNGDSDITQWLSTAPGFYVPFGDDFVSIGGGSVAVADTPGGGCHAIQYAAFSSPAKIFVTALNDHKLKAFTLNGGSGVWDVLDFEVDVGGDQALNLAFRTDDCVAVVVKDGSSYFVKTFAFTDGTPLGEYEHTLPGVITDIFFDAECLRCAISGETSDTLVSLNLSDSSAPVFSEAVTVPSGTGDSFQTFLNPSPFLSGILAIGSEVGSGAAVLVQVEFGECPAGSPVTSGFGSCFSLGSFLFVADNTGSALIIFDLTDPTSPSLTATLALANPPTDVVLLDTMAYLIAGDTIYGINIDDVTSPVKVIEKENAVGDFLLNHNGMLWASGESAGLRVFTVDPGEDDLNIEKYLPAPDKGVSKPAFTRDRIIFADLPETATASLRTFKFGGFKCHNVRAGHVGAYETDTEVLRSRIGDIRHLSTNALEVTGTPGAVFDGPIKIGGRWIFSCTGSPEGVITAGPGSLALSDSGDVYRKASGTGNTGWTTV